MSDATITPLHPSLAKGRVARRQGCDALRARRHRPQELATDHPLFSNGFSRSVSKRTGVRRYGRRFCMDRPALS